MLHGGERHRIYCRCRRLVNIFVEVVHVWQSIASPRVCTHRNRCGATTGPDQGTAAWVCPSCRSAVVLNL